MKKMLGIIVTISMLFVLVACGGNDDIVGTWKLSGMLIEGETYSIEEFYQELMSGLGLSEGDLGEIDYSEFEIKLEFKADGTFSMEDPEEGTDSGTWKADGDTYILSGDGETLEAKRDGNKLVMEVDGFGMVFTK